jgi:HTH-type transcriptional regulator / antitoxin HipB
MFPNGKLPLRFPSLLTIISRTGTYKVVAMVHIDSPQTLGATLRAARKRLGLTQADLALSAGVGLRFVVDLESGKSTVRLEQVLRVIDALGGSVMLNNLDVEPTSAAGPTHGA